MVGMLIGLVIGLTVGYTYGGWLWFIKGYGFAKKLPYATALAELRDRDYQMSPMQEPR